MSWLFAVHTDKFSGLTQRKLFLAKELNRGDETHSPSQVTALNFKEARTSFGTSKEMVSLAVIAPSVQGYYQL